MVAPLNPAGGIRMDDNTYEPKGQRFNESAGLGLEPVDN